jgi:hypothetical protein
MMITALRRDVRAQMPPAFFITPQSPPITPTGRFVTAPRVFSTSACYAQRAFKQHTSGTSYLKETD